MDIGLEVLPLLFLISCYYTSQKKKEEKTLKNLTFQFVWEHTEERTRIPVIGVPTPIANVPRI